MSPIKCKDSNKVGVDLQILSPTLQDSIKNIIKKANYINYEIMIKKFNTFGDNFLGQLFEIDIIGETALGKKGTDIFLKEKKQMGKFKLLPIPKLYINEMFVYTELSEIFTSLQDQANVPIEDRYKIAKAFEETDTNAIMLENLSKRGFTTYGKLEPIPVKYAELAMHELAKFHALSFIIEDKMPEYNSIKIKIRKHLFKYDEDWKQLMRNVCAHVEKLCDDEVKQKIKKFVPIIIEKFPKYCNDQTSVKCTLLHGDFKKNNVMVRLKDGEPVEVCTVDYQFIHYGCPVMDFLCFIFTSTDRQFRKQYLNHLKELYFETLSRFLKHFDMDVEAVYPRREFEKVYTEWLDYGLMITLFFSIVTFSSKDGVDFENKHLKDLTFCPDKVYDHIFLGLVDDFIEYGCL